MTTIGVLGAGQLGRMLALAGLPLGVRFRFLDPTASPPAAELGAHVRASLEDADALARFLAGTDVVTYETESIPFEAARALAARATLHPSPESLRVTQDRLTEKRFVRELGFEVAPFADVHDAESLVHAVREIGTPAILKTRTGGYDGRGQARVDRAEDAAAAWRSLGERPAVLERRLTFAREIALVAVRGRDGGVRHYAPIETRHADGILASAIAPAPRFEGEPLLRAQEMVARLMQALDHVGVLAVECFELDGRLVVNELAPRVHNSGHWTIEGAVTSQFENHVRAITGLPLGSTESRGVSGVVNLIGHVPDRANLLEPPGRHLHLYGKAPAPGRKLGHVTVCAPDHATLAARMHDLTATLGAGREA